MRTGHAVTRRMQAREMGGYFGIAAYHIKTEVNIGTLLRSAHIFGAAFVATVGKRYERQSSNTTKMERHIPLLHYADADDLLAHVPYDCQPVAVEITEAARSLPQFTHPRRALYILGPEDGSLPEKLLTQCTAIVKIPGTFCLNLAVAGSVVMYDRIAKSA